VLRQGHQPAIGKATLPTVGRIKWAIGLAIQGSQAPGRFRAIGMQDPSSQGQLGGGGSCAQLRLGSTGSQQSC
jgi:hypothetical protein